MGALIAIFIVGAFIMIIVTRLASSHRRWRSPRYPRNGVGGFWPVYPIDSNANNPAPDGQPPEQHHHGHHHHHHHDGGMPTDAGQTGHHGGFDGGGHHGGGGFDGGGAGGGHGH